MPALQKMGPAAAAQKCCPVCKSAQLVVYLKTPDHGLNHEGLGSSREIFSPGTVLRCAQCAHGFRENLPSPDDLASLYRDMDVKVYEAEQESRVQTGKRHVKLLNRWAAKGKLLDVGCASGAFLEQALADGWDVTGVEPNTYLWQKSAARVGGARLQNSTLEQAILRADYFDAVTLWDILEHVVDPPEFLRLCARALKPGGMVLLKTPDLDSFAARFLRSKWPLLLPEHLGYFTRASLRASAEGAGLELVSFARGRVTFTSGYILFRAAQHGIPLARWGHALIERSLLGKLPLSLKLGELYVILRRAMPPELPA